MMPDRMEQDARFMQLALTLGRRGQGCVWPNPAVGCVIVKQGRVLGRGWTQDGGRPHAETMALAAAGAAAQGATAYVTLEPCAHHGHTPPCCDALIAAGVSRVVCAAGDPDPRVNGQGFARLRAAGIDVAEGVGAAAAAVDHQGFFQRVQIGRPMVTLKLASSLDGRIATGTGHSQWITGPLARRAVHADRARHDAVMVGGGTARADDPSLTVRGMGATRQPVRVVLSRNLDLPIGGQLAKTARDVPLWLVHDAALSADKCAPWQALGAQLIAAPVTSGRLDISAALTVLASKGLTRIYCEGGGSLAASLMMADLVDELHVFHAGLMIGAEGTPSVGALGIAQLPEAQRFDLSDLRQIGPDVMQIWRRAR